MPCACAVVCFDASDLKERGGASTDIPQRQSDRASVSLNTWSPQELRRLRPELDWGRKQMRYVCDQGMCNSVTSLLLRFKNVYSAPVGRLRYLWSLLRPSYVTNRQRKYMASIIVACMCGKSAKERIMLIKDIRHHNLPPVVFSCCLVLVLQLRLE